MSCFLVDKRLLSFCICFLKSKYFSCLFVFSKKHYAIRNCIWLTIVLIGSNLSHNNQKRIFLVPIVFYLKNSIFINCVATRKYLFNKLRYISSFCLLFRQFGGLPEVRPATGKIFQDLLQFKN